MKIQNGDKLAEEDSVYYSYESGNYRLYSVLAPDKETVILKASNSSYKTILVPTVANSFFLRNKEVLGFKSGDAVLVTVRDEYNGESKDERATIYGICEQCALVKVSAGFKIYKLDALKKTK